MYCVVLGFGPCTVQSGAREENKSIWICVEISSKVTRRAMNSSDYPLLLEPLSIHVYTMSMLKQSHFL